MRALTLFLFAYVLTPAVYARDFPKDGNQMLDYCGVLVEATDNQASISSLNDKEFTDKIGQLNWCAGYLGATKDMFLQNYVNLGVFGMAGLTFGGAEKLKAYALETFRGPCIPDQAPILQLARVLVKWLREHPERLHELKSTLITAAFKDAFPCQEPTPKEAAKPTTVKP